MTVIQGGGNASALSLSRGACPGAEPWPPSRRRTPAGERRAMSLLLVLPPARRIRRGQPRPLARSLKQCAYRRSASLDFLGAGRWKGLLGLAWPNSGADASRERLCERSEAIQRCGEGLDCFVASLLAMTRAASAPAIAGEGDHPKGGGGGLELDASLPLQENQTNAGFGASASTFWRRHGRGPLRKRAVPLPRCRGAGLRRENDVMRDRGGPRGCTTHQVI